MILYDDKHNFLGMSSHSLSFLGYEDIHDFLSMHNDFANLFVNKEGYIYNFDNFNWIDFVLYSGSANKSALIKLKNGKETKVDISIKEIHLAKDLNGIQKIYSVKILSDNFNEISNTPKAETTGFSLSGLVTKEEPKQQAQQEEYNTIASTPTVESTPSDSFILNIADSEPMVKEEAPTMLIQESKPQENEDEFKLDFFKEEEKTIEEEPKQQTDSEVIKESAFLLKTEEEDNHISFTQQDDTNKEESEPAFAFNMLKDTQERDNTNSIKEEPKESFLLKTDSNQEQEQHTLEQNDLNKEFLQEDENQNSSIAPSVEDSGFKLDFLKTDLIQKEEKNTPNEAVASEKEQEDQTTAVNNQEDIIQQIKADIKEIDADTTTEDNLLKIDTKKEPSISFEQPQTSQVEQPIEFETKETEIDISQEEFSNFQMKDTQPSSKESSFTDTLKGLFAGTAIASTATMLQKDEKMDKVEEQNFSFNLKHDDNKEQESKPSLSSYEDEDEDEEIYNEQESEAFLKNSKEDNEATFLFSPEHQKSEPSLKEKLQQAEEREEREDYKEPYKDNFQNLSTSLSSLGLDADDEFNLLSDFIADTQESIAAIEQFTLTKDFDKINYALVKIKSSAEILNLNAIIDNATSMRKYCITENSQEVAAETQRLKENISMLEKHLEATAI